MSAADSGSPLAGIRETSSVVPAIAPIKQAFATLAGHDVVPHVAAGEGRAGFVEPQAAFLLFRPVARQAMPGEQRLDVASEVDGRGFIGGGL